MRQRVLACLLVSAALGACAGGTARPGALAVRQQDWRAVATPFDHTRLRDWRKAWTQALAAARVAGHGAAIAREGALLAPDAALPGAALPDGRYDCRVLKVGAKGPGAPQFLAYPAFECRIDREGGLQHFVKLTGSQRPVGHVYPDSGARAVFLGTLMLGDERMAMPYGRDRDRDLAGMVERVGARRWRLVLPYPRFESLIDVIELVPR